MLLRPAPLLLALAFLPLAIGVAGCGKSKEQAALDRMQNRKKPGLVRLVNLTDGPLTMYWMNRDQGGEVLPGSYNRLCNIGFGNQKIGLGKNDMPYVEVPLEIGERDLYTIVAFGNAPNIRTAIVTGEFEYPTSTRNVQVFFIDESGKTIQGTVTLADGGKKYELTDKSGGQMVAVGTYKLTGAGLKLALGDEVTNENTYSLLVVKRATGDLDGLLLRNTYIQKPAMAGAK